MLGGGVKKSNTNEGKGEQAQKPHAPKLLKMLLHWMAIPSISDGQSERKPVSSELHKIILAKVQKGYKLLLKKIKSVVPVKMHIYTLRPS